MSLYLKSSKLFCCQYSNWNWFQDWTSQNKTVGTNLVLFIAGLYHLVQCQGCSLPGVCFSAVFIDSNTHPRQPPFCEIKMSNFSLASHYKEGSCFSCHLDFSSFLSRGTQAGHLAHKVFHRCLLLRTLALLHALWCYLVSYSLRLLLFCSAGHLGHEE